MTSDCSEPVEVAAVVVTWNSAEVIAEFLSALPQALEGVASHRLVIVDNHSADATLEVAADLAPGATIVQTGRNAGYAAGFNAGVRAAGNCEALLVANPDTRPGPGSIAAMVDALRSSGAGIVVPRLRDADGTTALSLRREPTVLRGLGEAVLGGRLAGRVPFLGEVVGDRSRYERVGSTDWATGAAMLISRDCLAQVGPWDEAFFLYSEETDFALRARDAGYLLWYVPEAEFTHLRGDAPGDPALWSLLTVNRVRLFRRRHGRLHSAAFWAVVVLNAGLRALAGRRTHQAAFGALIGIRPVPRPEGVNCG